MEQRIGASSKPSGAEPLKTGPVTGAGFDPAFIPGISVPAPAKPDEPADTEPEAAQSSAVPETEDAEAPSRPEASPEAEETEEEAAEGPVFEASDRRAKIVADRKGVRLRLDEEACEFRWDEIAAVETETPRFGKRYTVTVHTPDRRWFPIEIEATARARFTEWDEQLDAVLDAYFEDAE
ncbi:hypothetical protein BFF78_16075 [Streptomyces fodineus]|uniref:Uncharacterized protein n=1 Tax=Streptomyces fodineus TaxID=1904616 RepID=A0A1D7YA61_9ACTN|nr:hypothetical protein [Streptomyces fodineus]AOR32384.1 hypothetical protein BFF78_16075 [Streptomyces fodineus]